jgi:hypothetical protein
MAAVHLQLRRGHVGMAERGADQICLSHSRVRRVFRVYSIRSPLAAKNSLLVARRDETGEMADRNALT